MEQIIRKLQYPSTDNIKPNQNFAKLLKDTTFGADGELGAILKYLYQAYYLMPYYPEISDQLETIADTEMMHYDLLNKSIVKLGGFPEISTSNGYFSSKEIPYQRNIYAILNGNIAGEADAISNYQHLSEVFASDPSLQQLMLAIQADEIKHKAIFEKILLDINNVPKPLM